MRMPPWICFNARLSATMCMKNEFDGIASSTAPKRKRALVLNLFFAESTRANAAAISKPVLLLTATAFTAFRAKSCGGNRHKTTGNGISAAKPNSGFSDPLRTQVAPAGAGAIMFSADSNGGDRRLRSERLSPCFFGLLLVALRFEFRELLRSKDALNILH
jgi:hypothetical protein